MLVDKREETLDTPSIDFVIDKNWYHVKGTSKGKSMNMQRNGLLTIRDTTWQGTFGTREGP